MAVIAICLCTLTGAAIAQSTTSIRGTVADEQGAVIPGAIVELDNAEIGFLRSTTSDASGVYQLLQVPPGRYVLTVMTDGFAVSKQSGLELLVGTPATLNVTMVLADVVETVNVEAEVAAINSVNAEIGNAFNETQVRQLPLLTRNVVELLSLQPGVTPTGETLGARRDQNNVLLDGVDVNDNQTAGMEVSAGLPPDPGFNGGASPGQFRPDGFQAGLPVPLDSVQEFRVTVGGQGAGQGRSSGGQVMLLTKSGTNQIHGSAYEFHRNTVTSANNWFNNRAGIEREQLIRNQFGASAGGPIVKNRVFAFFNFEQRIDASGASQFRRVPSETLKQGLIFVDSSDGVTRQFSPEDIQTIDPLGQGASQAMLDIFNQMPVGNDPASGLDGGQNFSGYRFNAPLRLDYKAYVAKLDFKLDRSSMHSLSVRGTLADNLNDEVLAQYPGNEPTSRLLNNSRGFSAVYTGVLSPTMINTFTFGLTRIGLERTGAQGAAFTLDNIDNLVDYTRGFTRNAPTFNIANDFAWTKGVHNLTMGTNIRIIRNNRVNFANAFPTYAFSRGSLAGLGSDIVEDMEDYLRLQTGNSGLTVSNGPVVSRAFGNLMGVIARGRMNYSYDGDGAPLPIGEAPGRNFASNEYELYAQDSWRVTPSLTLNFGLRYSYSGVPYERNGLQVAPTYPLEQFFADRIGAMAAGVPTNQMEHAYLDYDFIGPKNGLPSWWGPDKNNFAPRFSFAYAPQGNSWAKKLVGKNGVIRGGAAIVYDRFGSDLVTQFDSAASFGLSELQSLGPSTNFTTSPRYNGSLPVIPDAPLHTFPFTPPEVNYIGGVYMGISTDLKTPYSILLNFSSARELPGGVALEVGYAGRMGRGLLMQVDAAGWALDFKDPDSGLLWKDMAQDMRSHWEAGINPRDVRTNPGLIPTNPFAEKYFANLTNLYFPGSASANYYDLLWGQYGGSDADATHAVDRLRSDQFPNCIVATGCYTFYPPQSSGNSMWSNVGFSTFNAGTLSIRKPFSNGLSFDFNYTLSHAIDNGGAPEAGNGAHSGLMLNPFDYSAFRGSSDFDLRHNINANALYELPFGRGKPLFSNASGVLNQFVGGWQLSTIMRYSSGLPTSIAYTGLWPTNFGFTTIAYPIDPEYESGAQFNANGNPGIFPSTNESAANWLPMKPGEVGARAPVRLDDIVNFDVALAKAFLMPWEGHRIQLRAEAFNVFNNVNFFNPSIDANSPSNFGEFREVRRPRVMQFALRYEF